MLTDAAAGLPWTGEFTTEDGDDLPHALRGDVEFSRYLRVSPTTADEFSDACLTRSEQGHGHLAFALRRALRLEGSRLAEPP